MDSFAPAQAAQREGRDRRDRLAYDLLSHLLESSGFDETDREAKLAAELIYPTVRDAVAQMCNTFACV